MGGRKVITMARSLLSNDSRLFADLSAKTAKVIITPTLVITFTLVIVLAAWAVRKDIKSKRGNKENSPEEISKRIGVPLDLYIEHERDSSFAVSELIRILSIKNRDPQKIEYLTLLKGEKIKQEEELKKITDKKAEFRESEVAAQSKIDEHERYIQKVFAVLGLVKGFVICFAVFSILLYAGTLVLPILQFSWFFVFIVTVLFLLATIIWQYVNR